MARLHAGVCCAAGAIVGLAFACAPSNAFTCTSDAQCVQGSQNGKCEATGYCSFPDPDCESGQRYGSFAGGGLAGQCVDEGGTDGTSSTGPDPPTTTAPTGSTSDPQTTASTPATSADSSTSDDPPDPICGDGNTDPGEACDDGDEEEGDGCNPDCVASGTELCSALTDADLPLSSFGLGVAVLEDDFVLVGWEQTMATGDDLVLRRYGVDCMPRWTASLDEGLDERGYGLAVDATNAIWAVGAQIGPSGVASRVVARFDADGAPLGTVIGEQGSAHAVVHTMAGTAVFGTSGTMLTNVVMWAGSYSSGGALLGEITSTSGEVDRVRAAAIANDLTVFVTGSRGINVTSLGDLVVDAVQVAGFVEIARVPPTVGVAEGQGIGVGSSGDVFVGGFVQSMEDPGLEPTSPRDAYVARFTPDGTLVWADITATAATGYSDEVEAIAIATDDDVIAAGFLNAGSVGDNDLWVRRYTADGDMVWDARFDYGGGSDVLRGVAVLASGEIAVVGEVQGDDGTIHAWAAVLAP